MILSGFAVFSSVLAYHQKILRPENCSVAPQCKNCQKLKLCDLPQAERERSDGK